MTSTLRIGISAIFVLLISSESCLARWGTKEDANVILQSTKEKVFVHADGSYEVESDVTFSIEKEKGIDQMKLHHIPYSPILGQLTILSASTTNGTNVVPLALTQIEDKDMASSGHGLSSVHVVTIPFSALQVGSKVSYKAIHKMKAPFVPGLFHMRLGVASSFFTVEDVTEFRSEIPLVIKHKGASDVISVEESKEQNLSVLKVSLTRPVDRRLFGEQYAVINEDTLPRAEVGTAGIDWGTIAKPMSEKIELALQEPLPPEFAAILTAAGKKSTNTEKAREAMTLLIEKVKYLGDWRSEKGLFLPRTLAEIASSKQGDCKDFSFSTVSILRWLGIPASVAWVHRGAEDQVVAMLTRSSRAFDPLLPGMDYFNHAIVKAEIDGKPVWLDPTNPVAQVGAPFSDIADRAALLLGPKTVALSKIPALGDGLSSDITSYYAFRKSGRADAMAEVRLKGWQVNELDRIKSTMQKEEQKFVLFPLAEPPPQLGYLGLVEEMEPGFQPKPAPGEAIDTFSFVFESAGTKTSLGNSFQMPVPHMMGMLMTSPHGRITGINLGGAGSASKKVYLSNFQLQGDLPKSCTVDSSWAQVSRKYQKLPGGIIISDKTTLKKGEVPVVEMMSPEFEAFQKKLAKCFDDPLLVYKWSLPNPKAAGFVAFPNPLIRSHEKLNERIHAALDSGDQNYAPYIYSGLLSYEQMQTSPKSTALAISNAAAGILYQSYRGGKEKYDPDGLAESDDLFERALKIDPEEPGALIRQGRAAVDAKEFDRAMTLAERVLAKDPRSAGANVVKFKVWMAKNDSEVIRNAHQQKIIQTCNELIADPKVSEKDILFNTLRDVYGEMNNDTELEKVHLGIIKNKPKSAWALLNFAGFLNKRERFQEGAEFAKKALAVSPVGMARVNLSWALSGMAIEELAIDGNSAKGIALCEQALEEDNINLNCLLALGHYYTTVGGGTNDATLSQLGMKYMAAYDQIVSKGTSFNVPFMHQKMARVKPAKIPVKLAKAVSPPADIAVIVAPTNAAPPSAAPAPEPNRAPASVPVGSP